MNAAPNIAIPNHGDVKQDSSADADSKASNKNEADQSIDQSQKSGQSQAAGSGKGYDCNKCGDGGAGADQSQTNNQSNQAANTITQNAESKAIAVNAAPNLAILNHGDVKQESDADADSKASNKNEADQWIDQNQANHQSQTGAAGKGHKGDDCGCKDDGTMAPARSRRTTSRIRPPTRSPSTRTRGVRAQQGPEHGHRNGGGKGRPVEWLWLR